MSYTPTEWKDHIVEHPNRFRVVDNGDGTVNILDEHGNIIQQGTPVNAANLNKMEQGIKEGITKAEQAQQTADDAQSDIDDYKNEIRSLGLGIDVDPRTTENLDLEVQPGWVATTPETIGIPSAGGYGVVRIDRRAENRVAQTYYHLSGLLTVSMQMRTLGSGGTWTDWVRILHTGNTGSIVTEDYETGTWTPSFTTTGNPIEEVTYSGSSIGSYVRVGGLVFIHFNVSTFRLIKGNASGELRITGLPFMSAYTTALSIARVLAMDSSTANSYSRWRMAILPNSPDIVIYTNSSDASASTLTVDALRDHPSSTYNVISATGMYHIIS